MRYLLLLSWCGWMACKANQNAANSSEEPASMTTGFDSVKATLWGADDYGMKTYVLVLLKKGPNRSQDSVTRSQLQSAHMANINRLAEEGKLLMAGPMVEDETIRGIYLFDVRTVEEAKKLTETDPAIKAGSLVMEMHPWYSSAAIMDIPRLHKVIARKTF